MDGELNIPVLLANYGVMALGALGFLLWLKKRISNGLVRFTVESVAVRDLKTQIAQLRLDLAAERGKSQQLKVMADAYLKHLEDEHNAKRRTDGP